jgi:hypothetical protein
VITGKVKGPPKSTQDGSALVVRTTLSDGATVEEKFPKRRMRGKQKQRKQLVPAEDVLRTIEEATELVADIVRQEGPKEARAVNAWPSSSRTSNKPGSTPWSTNFARQTDCSKMRTTIIVKRSALVAVCSRTPTARPKGKRSGPSRQQWPRGPRQRN